MRDGVPVTVSRRADDRTCLRARTVDTRGVRRPLGRTRPAARRVQVEIVRIRAVDGIAEAVYEQRRRRDTRSGGDANGSLTGAELERAVEQIEGVGMLEVHVR